MSQTALLNAWQALLLAQAQVTQGFEHLITPPTFILRLTELLTSFLNDPSLEWSLDASAPSWTSQPLKLGFVRNLWTVARNVFAASILAGAAQTLLYEVLRHKYHLVQDEVRDAWAALCAELVLAGLPGLVKELWSEKGQDLDTEIKRGLWRVVSKRWNDDAGSWDGSIELLRAPFTWVLDHSVAVMMLTLNLRCCRPSMNWTFDKDDLDIWVRLVECALLTAYARKVSNAEVLDGIALAIGGGHTYVSLCKALPYLLSRVVVSPEHQQSSQRPLTLLKLANDVLVASYPPSDLEDKRMLLAIIKSLRDIIGVTHKEHLVDFLACVQQGVRVWILDEREVFTEEEYNKQVRNCWSVPGQITNVALGHSILRGFLGST